MKDIQESLGLDKGGHGLAPPLSFTFFCCHALDVLDWFGSIGLYEEQAIEAWHGHENQNASTCAAGAELQSAAKLVRTQALALKADDWRTTNSPTWKSAKASTRMATWAGI